VEASVWTERMVSALDNGVKGGRWYSLMDKVYAPTTLEAAWQKVQANGGAAGVDGQSLERFAAQAELYLSELATAVREGNYRPQPVKRVDIPKGDGKTRPLGIPTVKDRVVQTAVKFVLEPIFEAMFCPTSYGFRPGLGCRDALREVAHLIEEGYTFVVDADLQSYLDAASYCPLVHEVRSKSSDCRVITLIRIPFFLPFVTCATSSSPRLTRCNTVWREMPSLRVASCMVTKPSPAVSLNRATRSSLKRMRQGAPGVNCSPGMTPSLSQRCKVEGATPSTTAAFLIDANSPSVERGPGSQHGMFQCRRRLPTRLPSKRWPRAVVLP
jgi:RNA-directed DNA polymerase